MHLPTRKYVPFPRRLRARQRRRAGPSSPYAVPVASSPRFVRAFSNKESYRCQKYPHGLVHGSGTHLYATAVHSRLHDVRPA